VPFQARKHDNIGIHIRYCCIHILPVPGPGDLRLNYHRPGSKVGQLLHFPAAGWPRPEILSRAVGHRCRKPFPIGRNGGLEIGLGRGFLGLLNVTAV